MKTAVLLSLTVFLSSATLGVIPCGGPCAVGAECIQGKCILVSQQYTNNIQYSSSYSPYSTYNIYPWQVYNNPVEYPQANLYPCSLPCAYGYKCYQGKCVPESIAGSYYSGCYPGCPHGYKCYNGKCEILMDICGGCTPPLYCGSSGIC
jgi:hypothetical protein